jgi:hypothetical protein
MAEPHDEGQEKRKPAEVQDASLPGKRQQLKF